ncbi:uncharacterized protein LOC141805789 [Halichoeres trimaculatus]|uniref:uncharacterized protein LOC141805789 n=1 Tax=Halichoeres trimaculatus TaxID=147232 RepID=UPI003D9F4201
MFRRSRFSIRPNVGSAGRAPATSQEAPTASQEASEIPKDITESGTTTSAADKSDVTPSEKPTASGEGNDQNGEGTSTSAAVQRRKRFSIKPKVAPGRLSTLSRMPKSPAKAASETPVETSVSDLDKPTTSSHTGTTLPPRGLQSPRRRRPSEDSKQLKVQPKATIISPDSSGPSALPVSEDLQEQTHLAADSDKQLETTSSSPVKEAPSRLPDKVPSSLPDKEAIEISEKAKTLVSCERSLSLPPSAFSLSRLLNDPSDMQRIAKAQKLRHLLRQEMHKERRKKKNKMRVKEFSLDPAKMTMRDLIRYLPESNPMTSSIEETVNENETVVPPSPGREESPESAQEPEAAPKVTTSAEEEVEAQDDQDEEDDALMVPQVKVAEDGTLIIDEESLTVEVQRAKGPNPAQERDPIFERGSTTTYSSFRKGTYSRPWSAEETDMFFLAISMVGTDFSMICQLFPHRARSEIKNKFKKEERENSWRVDKAFRERRKLDIEYFSKLLEKILEVQKNRKKLKSLANKNTPKKQKRKTKSKKAAKKLSDVEEENEEEENSMPDLEGEGEKENEALCNEGQSPAPKPKKTRKRKKDASKEEPKDKKSKMVEKGNEQDEANIPEDSEAALPEDNPNSDISEKTAKDTTIKPAKLSRGRAPKPLLPLGRKWAKKLRPPSKAGDAVSDKEGQCVTDGAFQEQINEDVSPLKQANKKTSDDDSSSSEEEESTAPPPRPTRYGRVPKPTKPLNYPAKEDTHSSASESTPATPASASAARPKPKPTAKRARPSKAHSAQESKKPKLVTLRASQSDDSDEESEKQWEEEEEEEQPECGSGNDSSASVFVPVSLRSPQPLIPDVEETMEELDILANMPDVLGISQDALCPDASCEQAHNETCDHQLDLLVDVIDFLSSEQTEVSEDQSYNEAAETLLTISNVAHLSQAAQSQTATEEQTTEPTSVSVSETSKQPEENTANKAAAQGGHSATPLTSAASSSGDTKTSLELQKSKTDSCNKQSITQQTEMDPSPESQTEVTKTRRFSKVKPKPNLSLASRANQLKSRPDTSSARRTEETQNDANKTQAGNMGGAAERATGRENLIKEDDVPSACSEVKLTDEQESVAAASPVSQKEEGEDPSASQTRKSRFQRVKPKPNLAQTSRNVRSRPQTTKDVDENDSKKSAVGVSAPSPVISTENSSEKVGLTSGLSSVSGSSQTLTEESGDTKLDKSAYINQVVSEAWLETSKESTTASTEEYVLSNTKTSEGKCTSLQAEEASEIDPAPIQETSEQLPVSQKQDCEDSATPQTKRNRFQRVKPKPNLAQTSRSVRSKPQTTKDEVGKDSSSTPDLNLNIHEKSSLEVSEPPQVMSGKKSSENIGLLSGLSSNSGYSFTPTEKIPQTELESKESGNATLEDSSSKNQIASKAQVGTSKESTTESMEEDVLSKKAESKCTSLKAEKVSEIDPASIQEAREQLPACVSPEEESPVSQKQDCEDSATPQTKRSRFQRVKPKPNLAQTSRSVRSRPQTTKDTDTNQAPNRSETKVETLARPDDAPSKDYLPEIEGKITDDQGLCGNKPHERPSTVPSQEFTHKPSEEFSSRKGPIVTDAGLDSHSEESLPQRRQRFPKVKPKPNIGSSTRSRQTKTTPSDDARESSQQSSNDTTESRSAQREESRDSMTTQHTSHTGVEPPDSVPEDKSTEKEAAEVVEKGDKKEEDRLTLQTVSSVGSSQAKADDPAAVLDIQSSAGCSTESDVSSNNQSKPDSKGHAQLPWSEGDTKAQCQRTAPQSSDTDQSAYQSSHHDQPEPSNSFKSPTKAPQSWRGRSVKPKPNLGRSRQPPQTQQAQTMKQAQADSDTASEAGKASASQGEVCELQPHTQEPLEEALDHSITQSSFSVVTETSFGSVPQAPDNSTQDAVVSGSGGTHSQTLSLFPDMLSGQEPSDPDEPFFTLCLTEIPVCSSAEVLDSASVLLSHIPVTEASQQQHSDTGVHVTAVGGEHVFNVSDPEEDVIIIEDTDPVAHTVVENPVEPDGSSAVQPPKKPETVEGKDETEIPSTRQRPQGTTRRAKQQVKTNNSRKKQACETVAAKEEEPILSVTNATEESELPGLSVQPREVAEVVSEPSRKGGSRRAAAKKALENLKEPEESSSEAQRRQTRATRSRKPAETSNPAPPSDSPPAVAESTSQKVKTPQAGRKRSRPEPAASTPNVARTSSTRTATLIEPDAEQASGSSARPFSASQSSVEDFSSQHSFDSSSIEEATSVSQYFLSDIFTEVEEA